MADERELDMFQDSKEGLNKQQVKSDADALERVLFHVGDMGRYQKLLFFIMMPFGFFYAYIYFVQMFIAVTPQRHWCRVPELAHLDMELRRNLSAPGAVVGDWDRCTTYQANWTLVLETLTPPNASTPRIPCQNGWEFDLVDIPYHTVVSERGWVCEYAGNIPTAQSLFFVGSFTGGLLFGWIADRFGRIPALVGSNLFACIGGIATTFTTGLWDFAFCRFFAGMAFDNAFMLLYILILEYVGPQHRTWVGNMSIAIFFGAGSVTLPWLALWIGNWRTLLWVTSLPMLCVLFAPWVIPESVRWLLTRGRVNQAIDVLRKFEKVNGTKIPDDVMDDFIVTSRQKPEEMVTAVTLFKSSPLRQTMLVMVFLFMTCAILFDGLVRMSENLGLDFFIAFTLTSATEIPSITLLTVILDRLGRRKLTFGPLSLTGLLILIAAFLPKGIPQVSLAVMARFFVNMSFNTMMQWATELLPTAVRASGCSMLHMTAYASNLFSPFVIYSKHVWTNLPLLILGTAALISSGISLALPETKGKPMPQTIADGEKIIREHTICGKQELDDLELDEWQNEKERAVT